MSSATLNNDYVGTVKIIRKKSCLVRRHILKYAYNGNVADKIEVACGINQLCDLIVKLQFIQNGLSLKDIQAKKLGWVNLIKAGKILGYNIKVPESIDSIGVAIEGWVTQVDNSWVNSIDIDELEKLLEDIKLWFREVCEEV